jgi:hypothetical protein
MCHHLEHEETNAYLRRTMDRVELAYDGLTVGV